jgi:hypothetical protein
MSRLGAGRLRGPDLVKWQARGAPAPYGSSMCSTSGQRPSTPGPPGTDGVDRLGRAIDALADAAQDQHATEQDVAVRLAAVWDMVADLDPELARRLAGYGG